jgi:hypothetical protein
LLACGCASSAVDKHGKPLERAFRLQNVVKTNVDLLLESHQAELVTHMKSLTEKLYRRNPREFRKDGLDSVESAVARIFDQVPRWPDADLASSNGLDRIQLAFREDYPGDRVYALMGGLTAMFIAAFNNKTEFYVLDDLDPQKLYNAARNVEVAAWKLSSARTAAGEPFLLSNSIDPANVNLSFEREIGKLVGVQDALAKFIADKTNRSVVWVIQTAVFLPI